ncbi:MAG: hypothetical protein AUI14_09325 [Actinobacteria bacterium 13_2_20CM_2_71_6]|nr:MAG: hypothetical protein AUI14_09325 [Actinobacteria bacterium 13_2_20CM_2_71_6]
MHLGGVAARRALRGGEDDDGRDDVAGAGTEVVEDSDDVVRRRCEADLFGQLPQGRFDRGLVAVEPSAGQRPLAGVPAAVPPFDDDDVGRTAPLDQADADGGAAQAVRRDRQRHEARQVACDPGADRGDRPVIEIHQAPW